MPCSAFWLGRLKGGRTSSRPPTIWEGGFWRLLGRPTPTGPSRMPSPTPTTGRWRPFTPTPWPSGTGRPCALPAGP
ncbi:MAG: hypothetical protein C4302_00845 [Thermus sp.]